jgi:hypothetical protein
VGSSVSKNRVLLAIQKIFNSGEKDWPFALLQYLDHGIGGISRPPFQCSFSLSDGIKKLGEWNTIGGNKKAVGLVFLHDNNGGGR